MQNNSSQQNNPQHEIKSDGEYLHILDKAGTSGCYQWFIFVIVLFTYITAGFCLASIIYSTMNNQFDCSAIDPTWSTQQCQVYVCHHVPPQQIQKFPIIQKYQTIANQFGPFYCSSNIYLGIYRGIGFLGGFIGSLFFTILSDNFSRKKTWILCQTLWIFSLLMIMLTKNLFWSVLSFFVLGASVSPVLRLVQIFISEITQAKLKQKFISSVLGAFTVGNFLVSMAFQKIINWRKVFGYCVILPTLIILVLLIFLVVDTPRFILIQDNTEKSVKDLNWVAKFNRNDEGYKSQQLEQLIQKQIEYQKIRTVYTPIDLFRYKSLRKTSIVNMVIWFVGDFIFIGPLGIINHIGINNQFNSMAFTLGQLFAIPLIVFFISKCFRKTLSTTALIIAAIITLIVSFISVPAQCDHCEEGIRQICLAAITRTCIYFHFATLHNIQTQFYPVSIRNIGLGIPSSVASLAAVFSQITFMQTHELGINPFHIILGGIIVSIIFICFLPETLNIKDRNHIDEVVERRNTESAPILHSQ